MSMYPASLTGYFNSDLPTRTPTISAETLKVSLGTSADARVVQETFVKGRGGLRDPNLTNYIFPSYSQETYSPLKVYRNGVRQLPGDTDYKFWPGGWINRGPGPGTGPGRVSSSSDGTILAASDGTNEVIRVSTDSGTTWSDRDAAGDAGTVSLSGDGAVLVAIRGSSAGNLYVSNDLGGTWTPLPTASPYTYTMAAVSRDGSYILAATSGGDLISFAYSGGWVTGTPGTGYPVSQTWSSVAVGNTGFVALSLQTGVYVKTYLADPWVLKLPLAGNSGTVSVSDDGQVILFSAYGQNTSVSENGGTSWNSRSPHPGCMYNAISSDGDDMIAAVRNGAVYYSSNRGVSWVSDSYISHVTSIAGSSDLVKIVAGRYNPAIYDDLYTRNGVGTTPLIFTAESITGGEVITLEYLTTSTTVLPSLYPYN